MFQFSIQLPWPEVARVWPIPLFIKFLDETCPEPDFLNGLNWEEKSIPGIEW
jgi:hypothetical protein